MNPPNTIASDTLVEAIARAMRPKLSECIALSLNGNPNKWKQAEEILSQAALTAITEAGLVVCPIEPTEAMEEAARDVPFIAMGNGEYLEPDRIDIYRAMVNAINNGKAE